MERLLTPLVNRLLDKFVKKSQEGQAGSFKASLSGVGGFALHNLELDLASVIPPELLECERAFARSLRIKIPWTALNTQPIEVVFETVEILLSDAADRSDAEHEGGIDREPSAALSTADSVSSSGGGGGWLNQSWLGSNLQSLALRAGLNVSFTIKNLVVKYVDRRADLAATVALEQLALANVDVATWGHLVDRPEAWLMKNCAIKGLSVGLDRAASSGSALLPLLRLTSLSVSALLPIFAVVEGVDLGADSAKVAVQVELGAVQGALNDEQVRWAATLAASLQRNRAAISEPAPAPEEVPPSLTSEDDGVSEPEEEMKALGLFNRIWYMAVDEAAYMRSLEAEEDEVPPTPAAPAPTQAELTLSVDSLRVQLSAAQDSAVVPLLEAELGPTQLRTASLGTVMQDVEAQVQSFALRHNIAAAGPTSLTSSKLAPEWDEVLGLHPCEVPLRSGGRLRSATNAMELQQCRGGFEGEDPCCVVHVGQVWAAFDPSLSKSIAVFTGALSNGETESPEGPGEPPPAAVDAAAPNSPTETESGALQAWLSCSGGWEVDIDAMTAVMRVPGAVLALTAAGPVSFRSKAADMVGLRCEVGFALSESLWEAAASRAGQSSVPRAVPVTNTFSLTGSLGAEGPARRLPFLQFSSLDLNLSGSQVSAFLSCVSAPGSDGPSAEQPLAWASRARLQFSNGVSILRGNGDARAWQIAAPASSLLVAAAPADSSEGTPAARLDLSNFSCGLSPGLALSTDLTCLTVGELGDECEITAAPMAIVTGLRLDKDDSRQEFKFGSINVMGLPSTMTATMALKEAMDGGGKAAPASTELQLRPPPSVPADAATSSFAFDTIAFTLFPPTSKHSGALPVGVTGWLAGFSAEATPVVRRMTLGDAELSLCRLLGGEEGGIDSATIKAFRFDKVAGRPAVEASSTISAQTGGSLCEQFTAEVAAATARVTPELLATLAALKPPVRPQAVASMTPFIYPESSDPLLHGSTTVGAFRLEVAGRERWGGEVPSSQGIFPAFHVSFDEAFVLLHQELTLSGRPWLQGTRAVASTATAALLGVGAKVSGHAGGTGADCTQILVPSDINVNLSQWHPTGSSVLATDVQVLDLKVNAAALTAGTALANAFSTPESQTAEERRPDPVDDMHLFTDDLRSALFSLSGSAQPFGVALGDGVVEWRFPYPRTVGCIFVEGASPAEFQAPLLLSCFDDASGEFRHVKMRHLNVSEASFTGSCLIPEEASADGSRLPSVTGQLWRLAFSMPSGCKNAEVLLQRLYINPSYPSFWDGSILPRQTPPPPLATASTLAFSCGYLDVDFLAAHTTGHPYISSAHILNTLASVRMDGVLGALHQWRDRARAADGAVAVSIAYTEACTLRSSTVLERTEIRIAYEKGSMELVADEAVDGVGHLSFLLSQAAGGLAAMDWVGTTRLATRLYPLSRGPRLQMDLPTPLVISLSELATLDLQRAIAGFNTPLSSPIGISNAASTAVMFKQCGSASATLLGAGENAEFHLVPVGGDHGMLLGMQLCLPPAPGQLPEWSDPIDVMTGGGASVSLKGASYSNTSIAVMVAREGHRWTVRLADDLRIYNRQDSSLHILLPQASGMQCIEVAPNDSADIPLTSGVSVTHLRFWLGKEWSTDMSAFDKAGEVQIVQADLTFEAEAPTRGAMSVPLLSRFRGVDPSTGHMVVEIWPPITIMNKLPTLVAINLPTSTETFVLEPAASLAIPVSVEGGMIARIFGTSASSIAAHDRAPVLFCPPLAPHSDAFLLSQGLAETPKSASDVVYITSPGEAAEFELPCHGVGNVPCLLLTDPDNASPGLSLHLLPRWQAINKTKVALELQMPGSVPVSIAPESGMVMAPQGASGSTVVIHLLCEGDRLSGEFSLDAEECRVPLMNDTRNKLAWAGVEVKRTEMGLSSALEIIISHGFYVRNMTETELFVREPGNESDTQERNPLSLGPSSSLPVLSFPEYYEVAVDLSSFWQPVPVASKLVLQGKLYFEIGGTVSYYTVQDSTSVTLVFYRDPDPLVRLVNLSGTPLDLSWTSVEEQLIACVNPSQTFEFDMDGQAPTVSSDDIFLSTYPSTHPLRQTCTGGLLLLRSDAEEDWLDIVIEEGEAVVGTFSVTIQRRGRGFDLTIRESSSSLEKSVDVETLEACMHAKEICFVVLDDERGRVVGRNCARPTRLLSVSFGEVDLAISRSSSSGDPSRVYLAAAMELGGMSLATCFPTERPFMWAQAQTSAQMEAILSSTDASRSVCLRELSAIVPPISLNVDDASVQLYTKFKTLLQNPEGFDIRKEHSTPVSITESVLEMSSERIYLEKLAISKLEAIADIHLTTHSGLPVAVDTERSPLSISKTAAENISLPMRSILDGVVAHFLAEALLNAPLVIGSLQLFFNPTGLVRSIQRGVADMIDLPMQGLQRGGALEFLAGVGHGSVSLVREVSGWSMSSIVGFSKAASNALFKRSSSISETDELPGAEDEGERSRTGIVYAFSRIAETLIAENALGDVVLHAEARSVLVRQVAADSARPQAVFQLPRPVIIITTRAAIIYSDSGLTPSLVAWLDEAIVSRKDVTLEISSRRAAPFSNLQAAGAATISAEFSTASWARIGPSLRKYIQ